MDPQIVPIPNTPFYIGITEKTWDECQLAAENNGFTFASIRNQAENDAVVDYLQSNSIVKVWLGGYQTSYEDEPAGNWAWLDGTSWTDSTYINWRPGEPNNWNKDQNHLYLWQGTWWDGNKEWEFPCIFRDSASSSMPTQSPTISSNPTSSLAPSLAIQPSTTFFEDMLLFIDNTVSSVQEFFNAIINN